MALIKNSENRSAVARAVILDLGDLARQGETLKGRAREQADEIVAQAHLERKKIIAGADEVGYKAGLDRGLQEGTKKGAEQGHAEAKDSVQANFDVIASRWLGAIDEFQNVREQMLRDARHEIVAFAEVVARQVTKRAIELDERVVADQLDAVLRRLSRPSELVIAISPSDEAIAREIMPELIERFSYVLHAELVVDPALGAGSCVVRTNGGGEIDASVDSQIERILSVLLPVSGSDPHSKPDSEPDPEPDA